MKWYIVHRASESELCSCAKAAHLNTGSSVVFWLCLAVSTSDAAASVRQRLRGSQLENQTDGGKLLRQMLSLLKNSLLFFADVASAHGPNILIIHRRCDCQSHCKNKSTTTCDCQSHCKNKSTTKAFISPPRATDIKHESVQEK
jgi:hypothetical protein